MAGIPAGSSHPWRKRLNDLGNLNELRDEAGALYAEIRGLISDPPLCSCLYSLKTLYNMSVKIN